MGGGRSQRAGERLQGLAHVGRGVSLAVLLRTWCAVFVLIAQRVGREKGFLLLLLKVLIPGTSCLASPLPAVSVLGSGSHPKSWCCGGEHRGWIRAPQELYPPQI